MLPVKTVAFDKVEADDIIAVLSKQLEEKYNSKEDKIVSAGKVSGPKFSFTILISLTILKWHFLWQSVKIFRFA